MHVFLLLHPCSHIFVPPSFTKASRSQAQSEELHVQWQLLVQNGFVKRQEAEIRAITGIQ